MQKKVNPIGKTNIYYIFFKIHHLKAHNFTESATLSSTWSEILRLRTWSLA